MWIVPLALLILFESVADIFSKEWSLKGKLVLGVVAIIFYVVANTFWLFALKNGSGLARGAAIFSVASAIIAVFIGALMYRESVTLLEWAGIALGTVSIVLIFWRELF